ITEFTGKQPQIIIDIEPNIVSGLSIGQNVSVTVEEKTLTGVISALSTVANANLLSTVRISILDGQSYIGKSANISFVPNSNMQGESTLALPLDSVSIIAEGEGEISIYTSTGITRRTIKIGQTFGDTVEILDKIDDDTEIILTNLSNYDEMKQTLEKKVDQK
ncbi:hypothetical protein K2X92_04080, partial [Candidatus Gracilibacteria bacterium]|nr:hypothetical protein [Candidatus Gracilibacteria bacterium]